MTNTLTSMKLLQVVVPGERFEAVKELFARSAVSGYTVIPNVSGMGHHGYHEGRLLFNELNSQVMVIAIVASEHVDALVGAFEAFFERSSGIVFVTDCGVRRYGYFVAERSEAERER